MSLPSYIPIIGIMTLFFGIVVGTFGEEIADNLDIINKATEFNDNDLLEAENLHSMIKEYLLQSKYKKALDLSDEYLRKFDDFDFFDFEYEVKYFKFYSHYKLNENDKAFNFLKKFIDEIKKNEEDYWNDFIGNLDDINSEIYQVLIGKTPNVNLDVYFSICLNQNSAQSDSSNFVFPYIDSIDYALNSFEMLEVVSFNYLDNENVYRIILNPKNNCIKEQYEKYAKNNDNEIFLQVMKEYLQKFDEDFRQGSLVKYEYINYLLILEIVNKDNNALIQGMYKEVEKFINLENIYWDYIRAKSVYEECSQPEIITEECFSQKCGIEISNLNCEKLWSDYNKVFPYVYDADDVARHEEAKKAYYDQKKEDLERMMQDDPFNAGVANYY